MTIKEIFEHSQNVDGWILGIDGYASKVDLGNPAILAGIGKYRVKTIYPDVHNGKVVVEPDVETSIVTDWGKIPLNPFFDSGTKSVFGVETKSEQKPTQN